ncbi:hypothetical protein [Devosia sp. Naph2]|uniref:hypothetical protein n=1 Tax=Devosia polycyclovorans TaxID=3345148 RepID=UPI0035D0AE4E
MARQGRGFVEVPIGAYGPDYRPGSKRRRHEAELAQIAKTQAADNTSWRETQRKLAIGWGVAESDVDLFLDDPAGYRAMMDERERAKDEAARAAVEGGAA